MYFYKLIEKLRETKESINFDKFCNKYLNKPQPLQLFCPSLYLIKFLF